MTFWTELMTWLQCVLPKVNHRLRSFNGLRPRMVDFLGGGGGVAAVRAPKVNHRLRSFKGLRPRVVDFLGGDDDMAAVRAAKSQPSPTKFQGFAASSG